MLILTIVALFATIAFYQRGKQIGISPGRAASLPFVVLGIFLALRFVGARLIIYMGESLDVSSKTVLAMGLLLNLLLILAYLQFIHRNWKSLNQDDHDISRNADEQIDKV